MIDKIGSTLRAINSVVLIFVFFSIGGLFFFFRKYATDFPFALENIVAVVLFTALVYILFLLRFTFLARKIPWKMIFMILCIPVFMFVQQGLQQYLLLREDNVPGTFIRTGVEYVRAKGLAQFLHTEYVFFHAACMMLIPLVFFRLLVSIWRNKNRDTV